MKYSEEIVEKISKYLRQGATITTTCETVGIHKDTFYDWKKEKPDFSDAIKKAMAIPDKRVENALFKSATMGHRFKEKEFKGVNAGEKIKMVLVKTVTKVIPPNVTAQIFWLKNRKPDEWKDRQEQALSGDMTITVITAVPRPKKKNANKNKKKG